MAPGVLLKAQRQRTRGCRQTLGTATTERMDAAVVEAVAALILLMSTGPWVVAAAVEEDTAAARVQAPAAPDRLLPYTSGIPPLCSRTASSIREKEDMAAREATAETGA